MTIELGRALTPPERADLEGEADRLLAVPGSRRAPPVIVIVEAG